jgi:hypothetical protein
VLVLLSLVVVSCASAGDVDPLYRAMDVKKLKKEP